MSTESGQSPIFIKTEVFMKWLFEHTRKFPKSERFRLAKQIDDAMFAFHAAILAAANRPEQAREHLLQADLELSRLRAYLRLAMEMRYTAQGQFGFASQQTAELGKLLGGWLKTLPKRQNI